MVYKPSYVTQRSYRLKQPERCRVLGLWGCHCGGRAGKHNSLLSCLSQSIILSALAVTLLCSWVQPICSTPGQAEGSFVPKETRLIIEKSSDSTFLSDTHPMTHMMWMCTPSPVFRFLPYFACWWYLGVGLGRWLLSEVMGVGSGDGISGFIRGTEARASVCLSTWGPCHILMQLKEPPQRLHRCSNVLRLTGLQNHTLTKHLLFFVHKLLGLWYFGCGIWKWTEKHHSDDLWDLRTQDSSPNPFSFSKL